MEQTIAERAVADDAHKHHDVAVAVITPVGTYPDDDDFRRASETTVIAAVLEDAANKLKITNTTDWVARVDGREINTSHSFKQEKLSCIVEIEWHARAGGGGA